MTIKKKLGLGVASAALGLSLIGGGTWAAFNDVENLSNNVAAGTLDLEIEDDVLEGKPVLKTFNLSNLKPGDEFSREFKLANRGTLAIKDVWLDVIPSGFTNGTNEFVSQHGQTDNDADGKGLEFLDQFAVELVVSGTESASSPYNLIEKTDNVTLRDLVEGTNMPTGLEIDNTGGNFRLDLAPSNGSQDDKWDGIPVDPADFENVKFTISMINDTAKVTDPASLAFGEYTQNKYQGDKIDVQFQFEATQWDGTIFDANNSDEVNKKANPTPTNPDEVTRP